MKHFVLSLLLIISLLSQTFAQLEIKQAPDSLKWGVYTAENEEIIPPKYDNIIKLRGRDTSMFLVNNGGTKVICVDFKRVTVYGSKGEKFTKDIPTERMYFKGGLSGVFAANGTEMIPLEYVDFVFTFVRKDENTLEDNYYSRQISDTASDYHINLLRSTNKYLYSQEIKY